MKVIALGTGAALSLALLAGSPAASVQPTMSAAKTPPGNTLVVRVNGVPKSASPRVVVKGPNSYRKAVKVKGKKVTLRGLAKGRYTLVPGALPDWLPISQRVTVRVTGKKGAKAVVFYSRTGTA